MARKTNPVAKNGTHRIAAIVPGDTVLRIDREAKKLTREQGVVVTRSDIVRAVLVQHFIGKGR